MPSPARRLAKSGLGRVAHVLPQARFGRAIFVLSHMRAATTALTNVLASHEQVSGYGETHVAYDHERSLGLTLVNLALRRALKPRAPYLVDKILHNRLDAAPCSGFFEARAVFVLREPAASLLSIEKLARLDPTLNLQSPAEICDYYCARVTRLAALWDLWSPDRRHGIRACDLMRTPDAEIDRLGHWLALDPPLENRYHSHPSSRRGGGGDPTRSGGLTRIEACVSSVEDIRPEHVSHAAFDACRAAHDRLAIRFFESR